MRAACLSLFRSSLLNNIKYICVLVMALSYFVTLLHIVQPKGKLKHFRSYKQLDLCKVDRKFIRSSALAGTICGRSEITELHQQLQKHPIVFHPVGNAHRLFSIQYYKCYCVIVEKSCLIIVFKSLPVTVDGLHADILLKVYTID